jgi:glycine cleavage system H protein
LNPSDRKYTAEHEWVKLEDDGRALVGITHYAQDQLGDVVYFDLPQVGATVTHLEKMGEVESVKAVSDLYCPVSGEVVEVNPSLVDAPELVNDDPFDAGWLVRVALSNPGELDNLMSADDYDSYTAGL